MEGVGREGVAVVPFLSKFRVSGAHSALGSPAAKI